MRPINGLSLHVEEAGPEDGPLLILLHGFPGFSYDWRQHIEPLATRGFHVVALDMRGYNSSDKPRGLKAYHLDALASDVLALADSYGARTFRLVGHDWGGHVAWWTAAHHPDRVERVAILNVTHPDLWQRLMRRSLKQALRSTYVAFFQLPIVPELLMKANNYAAARAMLTLTSRPGTFSPQDLERYVQAWSNPGALTAMLNYYRALRLKKWTRPARVRQPLLLVWGTRDVFLERSGAVASLKLCDQGRVLWLEGATHWALMEEHEKVNAALGEFFAG